MNINEINEVVGFTSLMASKIIQTTPQHPLLWEWEVTSPHFTTKIKSRLKNLICFSLMKYNNIFKIRLCNGQGAILSE